MSYPALVEGLVNMICNFYHFCQNLLNFIVWYLVSLRVSPRKSSSFCFLFSKIKKILFCFKKESFSFAISICLLFFLLFQIMQEIIDRRTICRKMSSRYNENANGNQLTCFVQWPPPHCLGLWCICKWCPVSRGMPSKVRGFLPWAD